MLTGDVEAFRGQGSLKIKEYKLIAVPIITANHDALGLSSDPALMDRLIIVNFDWRLTKDKVYEFRKSIGKLLIGNKAVPHYLIKIITEVSNDLGGLRFFKEKFDEIYESLITEIEDEGRTIEKVSLIILGLIIANEVFRRVLGVEFDLEHAKKLVIETFKEPIDVYEFAPEELINLASIILNQPEEIEIPVKEEDNKKYYIISQEILVKLNQNTKIKLPRKLSDLKNMLLSLFRELDPHMIYKAVRVGPENKPTKAVVIEESLVYRLLGKEEEYKEIKEIKEKYNIKESVARGFEYCAVCGKRINDGEKVIIHEKKFYHKRCWYLYVASELTQKETREEREQKEGENDVDNQVKEIIGEPRGISEGELDS
jgi:hypothetical protein